MALDIWFPLAIYYEDVTDSALHNPALLARIQQLMNTAGAPRTFPTASWTGDVHNVDRLHLDPSFDWLTEQIGLHALGYLRALGHNLAMTDVYIQRSWPVISKRNQRVARHAHHTAHLSAVYYVAAPQEGDPGQIRIYNDSRPNEVSSGIGSDMTQGYSESNALNYGSALYRPIPGRLLLFPAKQTHSVEPNQTDEDRVSVSYDLILASRGDANEGHHEFLMPPPSVWKRIARSEPEMLTQTGDAPALPDGRVPLASLTGYGNAFDRFTIPEREGHLLWTPTVLGDCSSPAAWRDYAKKLEAVEAEVWLSDRSGTVWSWRDCQDWRAYRDAIDRVYVHLRDRDIPLDAANVTAPVVQRRNAGDAGPFQRGRAHLSIYMRLDHGDGGCEMEFAEGGAVALPPGGLLIASGFRRQRLAGASHVLHFEIDLPALARPEALSLAVLQSPDLADSTVFAAIAAQPASMGLPTSKLLAEKLGWIERRERRRYRSESCPAVQRFLLQHADPGSARESELALIQRHGLGGEAVGQLLTKEAALSVEQCETLRRHAEAHMTSVTPDTVDDLPEYQVNLSADGMRELLGRESTDALFRMPEAIGAPRGEAAERIDIFLRKYSPETRSYIAFHSDTCSYTLNIALSDESSLEGGKLLVLHDGALRNVSRRLGAAVLHAGNLVHGVSRIERGARYSLILFFHHRENAVGPALH